MAVVSTIPYNGDKSNVIYVFEDPHLGCPLNTW